MVFIAITKCNFAFRRAVKIPCNRYLQTLEENLVLHFKQLYS